VASALLEASRRLSGSNESTSSGCSSTFSASASWTSSTSEQGDKTGDLPNIDSWLGSWTNRTRTMSETDSISTNVGAWLAGLGTMRERANTGPGWSSEKSPVRRSHSNDVEEAMAGGLCKADIFIPPL